MNVLPLLLATVVWIMVEGASAAIGSPGAPLESLFGTTSKPSPPSESFLGSLGNVLEPAVGGRESPRTIDELQNGFAITGGSTRTCNSSELFDVLLRDFWLLQFGHSYLGGQLPDSDTSYALAIASCKTYGTKFEKHRFLIQSCFQAGEHKSTALQHRMAGLCNPNVLESIRPNLDCLRRIYSSRTYDVCMASALRILAAVESAERTDGGGGGAPMKFNDAPYHCVNVRQSILCGQYPMRVHCDPDQVGDVRAMFETVWSNNAVVEGHYECPLKPLIPFERQSKAVEDLFFTERRRLNGFCHSQARGASDSLTTVIGTYPNQIVRELLIEERSPVLSNLTTRLGAYMQCARVAFFGTNLGGRGTSFSPMHDWMSVLETFTEIAQDLRRATTSRNVTCGSFLMAREESTPCYQCVDKLAPEYHMMDYRRNRFSMITYAEAIVDDDDPLAFCRATMSLIKFLSCLLESVDRTCQIRMNGVSNRIAELRNQTETIYGCPPGGPWYTDLERMPVYEVNKKPHRASASIGGKGLSFCDS